MLEQFPQALKESRRWVCFAHQPRHRKKCNAK